MTVTRRNFLGRAVRLLLVFALFVPAVSRAQSNGFNPELWQFTGQIARNVYICDACTFQQYLDTPLPGASWSRNASAGNNRLLLPDFGTNIPPEAPPGVATSLDLLPEIEGERYQLIAQVLSASVLGFGTQGPIALAQVARGTTLRWDAGSLIHKVRSPAGIEFVLFSISEIHTGIFDPFVLNGLAAMSLPPGWAYESEVLATDFTIGTPTGIASVYSVPNYWAWQEVIPVPEPSTGVLLGLGLARLASGRRRS